MIVPDLVNQVAHVLRRPAVLEDTRQRMIAFSPQDDRIDPVREATILRQQAGSDVSDWLRRVGAFKTDRAVHVPANGDLEMLPRLLVPVRSDGERLGHLWFIEAPDQLTADQVSVASEFATRIGRAWRQAETAMQDGSAERADRSMRLLTGSTKMRTRTAREIVGRGHTWNQGSVRVLVLALQGTERKAEPSEALRRELRASALGALRAVGGAGLHGSIGQQGIVILTGGAGADDDAVQEAAERFLTIAESRLPDVPGAGQVVVGTGTPVETLVHARASYREARHAIELGAAFGLQERVLAWPKLGIYRVLHTSAQNGLRAEGLQPRLDELRTQRDGAVLLETLDCYLTTGGQVQEAAARLNLHRSSLYHRLARIEKVLRTDLQDGAQRLNLHASLLLLRLESSPL
ncbi:PucR family transcriptional regulator [Microbacterium sp. NPDC055910]|uniref:PucR family transcriptional regulator n=1 Tax=Microbacterium sp. NPDC055910 TaxID=3345659 RepID=UPI0035D73431